MSARNSLSPGSLEAVQEVLPSDYHHHNEPLARPKRTSLAQIDIPSFSAFRDRASSIPVSSPGRRNPLAKASPRAVSYAQPASSSEVFDARIPAHARVFSSDSTLPRLSTGLSNVLTPPLTADYKASHTQQNSHPHDHTLAAVHNRAVSFDSRSTGTEVETKRLSTVAAATRPSSIPVPLRYADKNGTAHQHVANPSISSTASTSIPTSSPSSHRRPPSSILSSASAAMGSQSPVQPPAMTVQLDGIDRLPRSFTDESFDSSTSTSPLKRRSKSPGTKFGSFFGWKSSPQVGADNSPTTTFSDRSASPIPSPSLQKSELFDGRSSSMGLTPPAMDTHGANQPQTHYFDVPGTPLLSGSSSINAHVEELEHELRQISSELASSIRREMELEDEVDRFRAEMTTYAQEHPQELNRRGSDYFSDSGTSSLRFPLGDSDAKIEELEKMRRKAEQEKAQIQVDYAQRLAQELSHRKELEGQLHTLEEQLKSRQGADMEEPHADERVRELETYLDDTRRRLSQERQAKDNFEDLFAALREESSKNRDERDNLRDEILPQLKARIEGLEAEAAEIQSSQYDYARLQQEIQVLRIENQNLHNDNETLQSDKQTLQNEAEAVELQSSQHDYDKLQQELQVLRIENQNLRNDNETLQSDKQTLQNDKEVLQNEAEAVELQSSQHDYDKMQQELQVLRIENQNLHNDNETLQHDNRALQDDKQTLQKDKQILQNESQLIRNENKQLQEAQINSSKFNTIAEDEDGETVPANRWPRTGLSRSNSLARSSSHGNLKRGSSLTRSGSVKEQRSGTGTGTDIRNRSDSGSVSVSVERMKDVEEQRDALHKALKNLLRRFENQKREHSKAMRRLMADRDRARSTTPARTGYSHEVHHLREEIGMLRRRADDALEHKWQAENNISGVKMALDRAEQETRSLRNYLAGRQSGLIRSPPRVKSIGGLGITLGDDEPELGEDERHAMIRVLRQSIQLAEHERDNALREAEAYRERARSLQNSEEEHFDNEQVLADELFAAATRMDELAQQVQQHLQSNMELRERLTDAVAKGERQQSESTARITDMQSRLKQMEDNVMQAQQQSEAALGSHEEEAKRLDEANSPHLSRLNTFSGSQRQSPVIKSPLMTHGLFAKSPILSQTSGPAESLFEATKTTFLERKVKDLEAALADADAEMKEVVERINSSQYEIAKLQSERDDAQRVMRRLQKDISDEKEKTEQLMTAV